MVPQRKTQKLLCLGKDVRELGAVWVHLGSGYCRRAQPHWLGLKLCPWPWVCQFLAVSGRGAGDCPSGAELQRFHRAPLDLHCRGLPVLSGKALLDPNKRALPGPYWRLLPGPYWRDWPNLYWRALPGLYWRALLSLNWWLG